LLMQDLAVLGLLLTAILVVFAVLRATQPTL
jgi:hypothetical protein